MSNSNLGLNRKVIKVLVDSLSDSDSKIYKDIMSITGESSGEVDENDTLINYLTDGTEVTTLTSNAVKKVADNVFNGYNELVTVNFPKATSIGVRSFQGCTSLNTVDFTSAKSLGNYAFKECSSLRNVTIPNVETIGEYAFADCKSLRSIVLPKVTFIGDRAFTGCYLLNKLILSGSTIVELANDYGIVFNALPDIFVPDNLVDLYKNDTIWGDVATRIKPLSQLPTE